MEPSVDAAQSALVDQLRAVHELTMALHRAESAPAFYDQALATITETLRVDRASLLLFDGDGVMRFIAWRGISAAYRQSAEGHSPWRADEADAVPILVPDVEADPSLSALLPALLAERIAACAFIPLLEGKQLIGKFMLYYADPHDFPDVDVALAQLLAGQVGLAVQRQRVQERLRAAAARLAGLQPELADLPPTSARTTKDLAAMVHGMVHAADATRRAAERAERLGELAAALVAAATVGEVRAALATHVQRAVACDAFSVREVDHDAGVARAVHIAGTPIGYQERFTDVALDTPSALAEVVHEHRPVFSGSAEETRRRYGVAAGAHYETTRVQAMARFPLLVEGELIAVLSVGYWEPREFDAAERLFLTTVADLAAQALGRAMGSERLRAEARRHRLLSAAQAAINRRLDPVEQLRALSRVVVPELADFSSVHILHRPAPPGQMPQLPVITDRVASEIIPGVAGPPIGSGYAWYGQDPITETIRQGRLITQPQFTPAVPGWARPAGIAATFDEGLRHLVQAPVLVDSMVVAVASFGMCRERPAWDADDLAIISEIAGYAATALEHGLTYQHTRETALVLQHALLSAPPTVPGLDLAARYRPAGRDEVGGDWYDAVEVAPGRVALAVGDVVGHDMSAAAAMGQLRAVLRTLALEELGPGMVLERLAEANRVLGIASYATVLFARLTWAGDAWDLAWASAGHLPPLMILPSGTAEALEQATGGLALVPGFAAPYPVGRICLPPAAMVVLYTDGLVERRGSDLTANITRLCRRAAALGRRSVEQVCDELLRDAPDLDDIAMLAVRTRDAHPHAVSYDGLPTACLAPRGQAVVAPATSSANSSDGFCQSKILRGRSLISAATAAR